MHTLGWNCTLDYINLANYRQLKLFPIKLKDPPILQIVTNMAADTPLTQDVKTMKTSADMELT